MPADPTPSDVMYDDMTRAWDNGDYPLAWALADTLLQYITDGGQPLTRDRDLYYTIRIHAHYAPADQPPCAACGQAFAIPFTPPPGVTAEECAAALAAERETTRRMLGQLPKPTV